MLKYIILHGQLEPREYVVDAEKQLIYLVNSKAACSSIKACMCGVETDDNSVHSACSRSGMLKSDILSEEERGYYKFTFVRNPFTRLVSCYESKYHHDKTFYNREGTDFDSYLFGIMKKDKGFENFVRKIVLIPDFLLDRHFCIQSKHITGRNGMLLVDYVGRFENMEQEFGMIAEKYGLAALPHFNRTDTDQSRWMDYYTTETAKLVYRKYRVDLERFGYLDSYVELRRYLKKRGK